ncbi:hypothetical protein FH620_44240, partial [Corallococcus exiguus]
TRPAAAPTPPPVLVPLAAAPAEPEPLTLGPEDIILTAEPEPAAPSNSWADSIPASPRDALELPASDNTAALTEARKRAQAALLQDMAEALRRSASVPLDPWLTEEASRFPVAPPPEPDLPLLEVEPE